MKVKFNRNVKHDGRIYNQGEVYEFEGDVTPELESLLETKLEDVFTQKREGEIERRVEVKVAEVAPEDAEALPQPEPAPKTASTGGPAPRV